MLSKLRHMALISGLSKSDIPVGDVLGDEDKMVSDTERIETPPYTINAFKKYPLLSNLCPATRNKKSGQVKDARV